MTPTVPLITALLQVTDVAKSAQATSLPALLALACAAPGVGPQPDGLQPMGARAWCKSC